MRSSSEKFCIAASARRLDVDNRLSLRFYYRIADNILKQADIFRLEKNIIDLYVMLLRFSSLVTETISCHREYRSSPQYQKVYLKKKLLNSLGELEQLKPMVLQKINEMNRKQAYQVNGWGDFNQNDSAGRQSVQRPIVNNYDAAKPATMKFVYTDRRSPQLVHSKQSEEKFHRISLNFPQPKEETLSKHSILGPNGLHGQWRSPTSDKMQPIENGLMMKTVSSLEPEKSSSESIPSSNDDSQISRPEEPAPMISFETEEPPVQTNIIRQPSPPPALAEVHDVVPEVSSQVPEAEFGMENSCPDAIIRSEGPLELHISTTLMENFMKMAKSNTDKNLETCGVLAGSLKNRKFYVTTLIIPKQESTSCTCNTTNEEEIFEFQDKRSLFPLDGFIHIQLSLASCRQSMFIPTTHIRLCCQSPLLL